MPLIDSSPVMRTSLVKPLVRRKGRGERAMGYVVDVVDMTDGKLSASVIHDIERTEAGTTVIQIPAIRGGLAFMVDSILRRTGYHEMNVLRIWGHGAKGLQNISANRSDEGWVTGGSLDVRHFELSASLMAKLRPKFYSSKSRIELRGCQVAQGDEGKGLMLKLARTVGVRVMAAWDDQAGMEWINDVYQAEPDGGFKQIFYTASNIVMEPNRR